MFRMPTGVTRHLLVINVIVFFVTSMMDESVRTSLMTFVPGSNYFKPYQIFTHMFMHADVGHLFFNMLSLYFFGPAIERAIGDKRFLILYFVAGLGAWALQNAVQYYEIMEMGMNIKEAKFRSLGASGCVFGILAGFAFLYPNQIIQMIFPPIPMKAKYFILIFGAIELFSGVRGFNTGIAHFAHIGGAIFGFLLLFYWNGFRFNK